MSKIAAIVITGVCSLGIVVGADQQCPPPPPLKCERLLTLATERCPDARLEKFAAPFTPAVTPCPDCPPQAECPQCADVPPTVIKEFVDMPVYVPQPERGQWYIGGGLSMLATSGFDATWDDEHRSHSLTAERGHQLGVTLQGGYKFPRGVMLLGSVTKYGGSHLNVALYDSRGRADGEWVGGDGGGGRVSVGATVLVPVGRK